MSLRDAAALVAYAAAAWITLVGARLLRDRGARPEAARKLVHVVAGLSPLVITRIAEHRWAGLLPYGVTPVVNLAQLRAGRFRSIRRTGGNSGIVTLPLAQFLLLYALWRPRGRDRRSTIAYAAIATLAVGDASAALVGERYGRRRYHVWGSTRSLEGSAAMFASSLIVIGILLARDGHVPLIAPLAAGVATGVEAVAPPGSDNLLVPAAVALTLVAAPWMRE